MDTWSKSGQRSSPEFPNWNKKKAVPFWWQWCKNKYHPRVWRKLGWTHTGNMQCRAAEANDEKALATSEFLISAIFKNFYLFIWLGCCCCSGFSVAGVSRGLLSRCGTQASHCGAFPCYGAWAQAFRIQEFQLTGSVVTAPGPRALAQLLWHTGTVAPRHVASFQSRDWTLVSCTGRRILYH